MPRRAKDGIPGSVYAKGGYLYIKARGRAVALSLPDTAANRRMAARIKRDMWLSGFAPDSTPTVAKAWERFTREANVSAKTMAGYEHAYRRLVPDGSVPLTSEALTGAAAHYRRTAVGLSPVTINTVLRNFRRFAMWAARAYGLQPVDISSQMVRAPAPAPSVVGRSELEGLPRHPLTPLFAFMACTGARPVDVWGLRPSDVQGGVIAWRNKITKAPEPRPVHPDALLWLPMVWQAERMHPTTYPKVWKRDTGYRLKDARPTFLALIAGLPWDVRVYLMRHHPQGVTEKHYLTWDMASVAESLSTVWLPTPRNVLAYKGEP